MDLSFKGGCSFEVVSAIDTRVTRGVGEWFVEEWVTGNRGVRVYKFGGKEKEEDEHCIFKRGCMGIGLRICQQIQVGLSKTVRYIRTDNGTEFVNHTLTEYYERIGIFHQKTVPITLQQNDVVERQNRTLVEAVRTMLIFSKAPMFLWAEVVAMACYTQNQSLIHTHHNKTPYELVYNNKPDLTFFRFFGALCYPTNDCEDLGKLQPTADIGIFVGYAPSRKGYRIYNKRTRRIMKTIHIQFDELTKQMAPVHLTEYTLMGNNPVAPVDNNPFINVFAPEPSSDASSSGDVSSIESTYVSQTHHHLSKWSKDHPFDNVIGNPSRSVSTRKQLATDALWCLYNSVLSKVEPKNFKSAITGDCWFQAMQDEIHEFDRLQV
uniref:Retrovirus-related Pol polyprotein from transposon TNT 1-94 n=1 Tax=Tanacetum cinerariifolium TaxID=118510 RepID=A0A699HU98_TANCI|nr:retrovirus-related Pol polyprotein from transposon TNT 1-94 [Tanacetum cinerariifolium]